MRTEIDARTLPRCPNQRCAVLTFTVVFNDTERRTQALQCVFHGNGALRGIGGNMVNGNATCAFGRKEKIQIVTHNRICPSMYFCGYCMYYMPMPRRANQHTYMAIRIDSFFLLPDARHATHDFALPTIPDTENQISSMEPGGNFVRQNNSGHCFACITHDQCHGCYCQRKAKQGH